MCICGHISSLRKRKGTGILKGTTKYTHKQKTKPITATKS